MEELSYGRVVPWRNCHVLRYDSSAIKPNLCAKSQFSSFKMEKLYVRCTYIFIGLHQYSASISFRPPYQPSAILSAFTWPLLAFSQTLSAFNRHLPSLPVTSCHLPPLLLPPVISRHLLSSTVTSCHLPPLPTTSH